MHDLERYESYSSTVAVKSTSTPVLVLHPTSLDLPRRHRRQHQLHHEQMQQLQEQATTTNGQRERLESTRQRGSSSRCMIFWNAQGITNGTVSTRLKMNGNFGTGTRISSCRRTCLFLYTFVMHLAISISLGWHFLGIVSQHATTTTINKYDYCYYML
jgi:hypothetical protein